MCIAWLGAVIFTGVGGGELLFGIAWSWVGVVICTGCGGCWLDTKYTGGVVVFT